MPCRRTFNNKTGLRPRSGLRPDSKVLDRTGGIATVFKLRSWSEPRGLLPGSLVPEHGIENDEQLAHASGQSHLLLFAGTKQPTIEGFDNQIVFGRYQRRHVKRGANACTTTASSSFAVPFPAITRMRCKPAKRDELLVWQVAQLRQFGDQHQRSDRTDARYTL